MFVTVAYMIAVASFVGPSHDATIGGCPAASSRFIESPATTGSSTSSPSAMISVAIDTCCRSMPSKRIIPKDMRSVNGIDSAISSAERHSQNPINETMTTSAIASYRLVMKRSMFSVTWSG